MGDEEMVMGPRDPEIIKALMAAGFEKWEALEWEEAMNAPLTPPPRTPQDKRGSGEKAP